MLVLPEFWTWKAVVPLTEFWNKAEPSLPSVSTVALAAVLFAVVANVKLVPWLASVQACVALDLIAAQAAPE